MTEQLHCTWLQQQIRRETNKDGDTLRWRMPSAGKHLQLCFVNDLVLSFPRRHVVWMQFFIPISTQVSSQRITLIEVKWEGACFLKKRMWSTGSKTAVLNKWGPTGPRPVITRSMNSEINAFMTESSGILKMLPGIRRWMVPYSMWPSHQWMYNHYNHKSLKGTFSHFFFVSKWLMDQQFLKLIQYWARQLQPATAKQAAMKY